MTILETLYQHQDKEYAKFQAKLTPTIEESKFIGVRVPDVRTIAKQFQNTPEALEFINALPHEFYDENMLHGLFLSAMKDYNEYIKKVDQFLPYVDNWAVCDIMSPKVFTKHKDNLIEKIKEWARSDKVYTIRFGLEMLMSFYLDDDFKAEYLEIPAKVKNEDYYVKMMVAWFYATALAKQWDSTIKILLDNRLDSWVHNKTIQKAIESRRITEEQKEYLKTLKK